MSRSTRGLTRTRDVLTAKVRPALGLTRLDPLLADTDSGRLPSPRLPVTHGFTLTSRLPLPTVIDAVLRGLDQGSSKLPLVVSLENHTEDDGFQAGLVKNFTEIMGTKSVTFLSLAVALESQSRMLRLT